MAIILITGTPGSGKTLYAMSKIREGLKTGRPIFTNINGCSFEGVEPIPENDKGELDWTLTPAGDESTGVFGSLVVYDEAQKFDFFAYKRGEKLSSHHIIKHMEDHRHKAYDIILITQSPKFLHLHFGELVNEHYHVVRRFNRNQSEIHLHRKIEYNPISNAAIERAEDVFKLDFDKKLFEKYKSTVAVTNKEFRLSGKLKRSLYIIGGILILLVYLIFFKDGGSSYLNKAVGVEEKSKAEQVATTSPKDKELKMGFGSALETAKQDEQKQESPEDKLRKQLDVQIELIQKQIQLEQLQAQYQQLQQSKNNVKGMIKNTSHCQIIFNNQIVNLNQSECNKYMQRPIVEPAPVPVQTTTPVPVSAPVPSPMPSPMPNPVPVVHQQVKAEIVMSQDEESELLVSFADFQSVEQLQEESLLTADFTELKPIVVSAVEPLETLEQVLEPVLVLENELEKLQVNSHE